MRIGLWSVVVAACTPLGDKSANSTSASMGSTGSYGAPNASEPEADTDLVDTGGPECDTESPVVLFASPDDSNSMSSPVQVRESVLGGWGGQVGLRPWEFFNYAQFDYPPAASEDVDVHLRLAEGSVAGTWEMMVAIRSDEVAETARTPLNLVFSVDTSGSMAGEPLRLVKDSLRVIAAHLREQDVVAIVRWSDDQTVHLDSHEITGANDSVFLEAVDGLVSEGSTNLAKGLSEAYRLAAEQASPYRTSRVVLLSDGGANTGVTDEELIGEYAGNQDEDGIYMTGVGVGSATTYNDFLMDRVTDLGKGAALFIPSVDEAERMFGGRFQEVFDVGARNLAVRYELPAGMEVVRFSGEALSAEPLPPQHLGANDTVVMHQLLSHCAPELLTGDEEIEVAVSWQHRDEFLPFEKVVRARMDDLLVEVSSEFAKGSALFAYTEALRARSEGGVAAADAVAFEKLAEAEALDPGDDDLAEIRAVLEAL
jgi:Ca-activated chloride channel family protein